MLYIVLKQRKGDIAKVSSIKKAFNFNDTTGYKYLSLKVLSITTAIRSNGFQSNKVHIKA